MYTKYVHLRSRRPHIHLQRDIQASTCHDIDCSDFEGTRKLNAQTVLTPNAATLPREKTLIYTANHLTLGAL